MTNITRYSIEIPEIIFACGYVYSASHEGDWGGARSWLFDRDHMMRIINAIYDAHDVECETCNDDLS